MKAGAGAISERGAGDVAPLSPRPGASARVGASALSRDWAPLRYFNLYRLTLSGLFFLLALWGGPVKALGQHDHRLFLATASLYLLASIASSFAVRARWPAFDIQVVVQVFVDIVAITVMMHASAGLGSGFEMLLVVAVAGGSILTQGRIAVLFAAMATLAVLTEQVYVYLSQALPSTNYTQAGILGVAFFATALLSYVLARRIRASEALAFERGVDLANMAQLNEHIIQRMQSGIVAVDGFDSIRLANESAVSLLGAGRDLTGRTLRSVVPELRTLAEQWRGEPSVATFVFRPANSQVDVMAAFAALGTGPGDGAIIFLEDASGMRQRAQQLKLASLGRLTASIAHEIRNPLGAISHAAQLLAESERLTEADRRLTQIVRDNCRRMDAIVENVLQLSRRKLSTPESLELKPWLDKFVGEFVESNRVDRGRIGVHVEPPSLRVRTDASQLHQVVWNLCENGLRHGGEDPELELRGGMNTDSHRPYLDVLDNGPGISPHAADDIFEPFFTTDAEGTGLGLYIARELCESNQASLNVMPAQDKGGCFRITFPDPRRQGVTAT